MKKIMIGALAILAAAMPLSAFAAPKEKSHTTAVKHEKMTTTNGTISSWAPDTRMLKLASGDEFKVDAKVKGDFKSGQQASVHWKNDNGAKLAETVSIK
jgi:hypothetical protein